MTDQIGRGVIELSADSGKLNAAINDARRSIKSLGDDAGNVSKRQSDSIDRYVRSLQTQAAVQGKSTRETELYKLALRGASDEQLKAANAALRLSDAYQKGALIGERIRTSLLTIGAVAATGLIAAAVAFDRLIDKAGNFQDLAEKTGDSAQNIASLAVAAGTAGLSMDTVAAASIKLTKNLTGVDDESKAAGAAIKALGLNLDSFKALAPADQLEAIGKALNGFEDGAGKTAVAVALLGKSGADALPFLKELGAEGGRQVILTEAQIKAADDYSDAQKRLSAEISLHAQAIATDMLPALTEFTALIRDIAKDQEFSATASAALNLAMKAAIVVFQALAVVGSDVAFVFKTIYKEIVLTKDQFVALAKLDLKGFAALSEAVEKDSAKARAELDRFQARVMSLGQASDKFSDPRILGNPGSIAEQTAANNKRPKLVFTGATKPDDKAAREAEQVRRAELENDLKFLRDKLGEERDTIAFHQRELSQLYQAGAISLREFYDQRNKEISDGVQRELNLLTDEQARLEVELSQVSDPSERIKLQGKLDEAVQRSSKVVVDAARAASISNREEAESFKQLSEQVQNFKANLLAAQGDTAGAAAIRNADAIRQVRELQDRAKGSANPISDAQVNAQIAALNQTEAINTAKDRTSEINQRLAIEEDRIALAQKTGATTELGALAAIGEARSKIVGDMEKQVAELERIAKERDFDIQLNIDASRARLELDKLKADLDPLKEKFDNLFKDAGSSAIGDLLNGKTNLKGALTQFLTTVGSEINNTLGKEISGMVFGKGGPLGELGGIFSGIFGKKGAAPAIDTSSVTASLSALQTSGADPATQALTRLAQAADGASGSIGSGGGFDKTQTGESSIAELFNTSEFTDSASTASAQLARLAASASSGTGALGLLPSIISAIASAAAASSASSSGGGGSGGIWGSLLDAAASYFTGGSSYSYNGGVGTTNAAGISGGRAGGGTLQPNRIHPINEMGIPETLTTRGGQQYLMPLPQGGTVSPGDSSQPMRPVHITQQFYGAADPKSVKQQAVAGARLAIFESNRGTSG